MSSNNDQKPPAVPAKLPEEQYFPPPPPGPPPGLASKPQPPQHPNETPIPDYEIPPYDPAHPQFAPPPKIAEPEEDIYDATPTEEHPPPFPPRPTSSGHHAADMDGSKHGWGHKLSGWGTKAAGPINALANKIGSESFLPTTLDKECEKAARILRSFAKDGIYSDGTPQNAPGQPAGAPSYSDKPADATKGKKSRVLLTIPSKVIARAQGLAIFTTARAGFQVTGATGSGILIARLPDGSWSPPSGIQVHSVGAGFVIGLDIYDCVVVINTREALEAFTKTRMSLGSDLAVTAGPWGAGGAVDFSVPQSQKGKERAGAQEPYPANFAPPGVDEKSSYGTQATTTAGPARKTSPLSAVKNPVYSYVKSRGFYAGVQIDGTVVTERKDANSAFYGVPVSVEKIIKGEVPAQGPAGMWPIGSKTLLEALRGAEGWRAQPPQATQGQGFAAGAPNVAGVAAGVQGMSLGGSSAGPSTAFTGGPAPPPASATSAADAKAAEAAAEAAANRQPEGAAPPSYAEPTGVEELPPAYVDDGEYRPPVDSKMGQP